MTKTQIVKAMAEKLATEPKQISNRSSMCSWRLQPNRREKRASSRIPGLGKLVKAERKERMGRNPCNR